VILQADQVDLRRSGAITLSDSRWLTFVQSQPDATIFHHPIWTNLMAQAYGYRPLALVQTAPDGQIVAGLPLLEVRSPLTGWRFVSLPFTDYCPPLARDATSLSQLSAGLALWRKSVGEPSLEARGEMPMAPGMSPVAVAVRHVLPLQTDSNHVFRRFRRSQVQQIILKAQHDGVQVHFSTSRIAFAPFYHLHLQTRRRLGVPIQPKRFLAALWTELVEAGLGFVILACKDSQPIASAVFLAWNGTVIYKYSASDPNYWKLHPNHLVLWTAIQWGCAHGYHRFDFGRTDLADHGLRHFKNQWGTTELPLIYSYFADKPPSAPPNFQKRIVAQVIQHSPPVVCQVIGELLYGHFA